MAPTPLGCTLNGQRLLPDGIHFESGIELDDVPYALKQQLDRRACPSDPVVGEHWFVLAVAEAYGRRVILPVLKEKLEAQGEPA